jgi:hypothetical protein
MSTSVFWRARWREQLRRPRLRDLAGAAVWDGGRALRRRLGR